MNIAEYKGVMVFAEQRDGVLESVGLELIGEASRLAAHLKESVTAVLVGSNIKSLATELASYGADRVIIVDDAVLSHYDTEAYTQAVTAVVNKYKPEIFLVGATTLGRDLAPRLSGRLRTGLTADCTELSIDEATRELWSTRPTFGGNLLATIVCPDHRPQMSSVRPGVMAKLAKDTSRKADVIEEQITFDKSKFKVRFIDKVVDKSKKIDITEAKVLVAGGRGVGKEGMPLLINLAQSLHGELAGTRALVEEGMVESSRQVGQTGKTVKPDLYIAAGISGAIQHVIGMENSELTIAINTDKEAPIFQVADLGVVANFHEVAPVLIKKLGEIQA
ncbi:electron transfer flavoprotein subunit alpha/FixB family protein [Entomospira culicis]|uniref:Electron transfer flavoprotein subunit alpha/FixB family protein n=1 Tax=Entomospira culicis TaxID=2719989 RepID=A0A968GID7_9SPIO|nr:electron transfer flavoprotein subunit alpha/FixB family protein [Entomospira culicis]NIZ18995.1 electron transfer flavoprotein subunit alpha/FixB family protein [Entomospira culicis]NIZ69210.1 electron transfer flavoprotein subunit alpha/FixB family protein [Entomospira culicis]WDI37796.1 electron transfer flavoprotein subunit alpha/FixB family protein [Entomospira culicis]WDI39424.1 electron transfer flavoprotein subunit alpha/FixB family protein [Entomospira culicis]